MDYRQSHLHKGEPYERNLASNPWDAYMARWEARHLRALVPNLVSGSERHLDFACGTGRIASVVAPLVGETVGVDVSESMLRKARGKCPTASFIQVDLTCEEHAVGVFDLATAFRFLGNAEDDLRSAALRAIYNALRPNGLLIVNNHRNPNAIRTRLARLRGEGQDQDLSHRKLTRLLTDHGFRVTHVQPIGVWVWRAALSSWDTLTSRRAEILERAFGHRTWAPLAPDCLIVARRE